MHGTIMLLLFATPLFVGFANEIMPLQIGAPDVAFPAAQPAQLLHVHVRRPDPAVQLPHARPARPRSAGTRTHR